MTRARQWTVIAAALLLVTQACGPGPGPAVTTNGGSPQKGGEIVYASIYDPRSLDPARDDAAFTLLGLRQLYDGLVVQDNKGKIHPHLATSWDSSSDKLTWTFKLRDGVKFHDGTPLNAQAVKFSIDRISEPTTTSPAGNRFRGAISRVEAVDGQTVRILLKQLYAPFLTMLATSWAYIVSPAAVQKHGQDFGSNPVGTGAFKFVSWQKQDRLTLERNDDYAWAPPFLENKAVAHLDRITLRQISEPTALGASMETGETHLLGFLDIDNAERLAAMGHKMLIGEPPSSGWLYYMNTQKAPTDDVRVRRAIAHAIDNVAASKTPLWRGDGDPIFGPLNPNHPFASKKVADQFGFKYDPEKAKQLLEEAGWKVGADGVREKDGKKLILADVTNAETLRYSGSAQIVQQQLRNVGIGSEIKSLTQATFSQAQARGEHNIAIRANVGDDPSAIFQTMVGCSAVGVSGQNLARYCSPEVDRLIDEGLREFDEAKRFVIYEKIQETVMREALAVPFTSRRFVFAIRKDVGGFVYDLGLTWFASELYLKK